MGLYLDWFVNLFIGETASFNLACVDLPKIFLVVARALMTFCLRSSVSCLILFCSALALSDAANLDEDALWPVAFALKELTAAEEAKIGALVKKAVS